MSFNWVTISQTPTQACPRAKTHVVVFIVQFVVCLAVTARFRVHGAQAKYICCVGRPRSDQRYGHCRRRCRGPGRRAQVGVRGVRRHQNRQSSEHASRPVFRRAPEWPLTSFLFPKRGARTRAVPGHVAKTVRTAADWQAWGRPATATTTTTSKSQGGVAGIDRPQPATISAATGPSLISFADQPPPEPTLDEEKARLRAQIAFAGGGQENGGNNTGLDQGYFVRYDSQLRVEGTSFTGQQ